MSNETKSPFAFEIGQLVRLEDREGQVTARTDYGHREPDYCVQCMMLKTFGPSGSIMTSTRGISESELLKLQPPKMVTEEVARRLADNERKAVLLEAGQQIEQAHRRIARLEAAAKRRRKASRTASRKRR